MKVDCPYCGTRDEHRLATIGGERTLLCPSDDTYRLLLVEEAWEYWTKGELSLIEADDPTGYDAVLASVVLGMFASAREYCDTVDAEQLDMSGNPVDGVVSDDLVADRVACALQLLWYGVTS